MKNLPLVCQNQSIPIQFLYFWIFIRGFYSFDCSFWPRLIQAMLGGLKLHIIKHKKIIFQFALKIHKEASIVF